MKKIVRRGLHTYGYLLIIATITAVFGVLTTIGVSAEVTFDTSYYKYNGEEGVCITGFNGLNGGETVTIPAQINGKKVFALGNGGNCILGANNIGVLDLTNATNLTMVEKYAFFDCTGLTGFSAPKVTTVGEFAFFRCTGLTSFSASALTTLEKYAFYDCTGFTSFSASALEAVGESAFSWCIGLTSLNLPKVTTVGESAFKGCSNLTKVTLKEGCSGVSEAFYNGSDNCEITYVNDNGDVVKTVKLS